ncbi:hypothetical protein D3C71_1763450 [compost metagenome]
MFRPASTAPAPSPSGMAHKISQISEGERAKPVNAPAVITQLTRVTFPVPKRRSTDPLIRLDTIVPAATIINNRPAVSSGAPKSTCMTGHAEPSKESGSPKLIKAK